MNFEFYNNQSPYPILGFDQQPIITTPFLEPDGPEAPINSSFHGEYLEMPAPSYQHIQNPTQTQPDGSDDETVDYTFTKRSQQDFSSNLQPSYGMKILKIESNLKNFER